MKAHFSKRFFLSLFSSFSFFFLHAQGGNAITQGPSTASPHAKLDDLSWIAGSWEGEAFGAKTEEVWASPKGTSMMGMFKLYDDEAVVFYELMTIREVDSTLFLQIKHFNNDLKGWEEKDETVDFRLLDIAENRVYFEGLTFEKISANAINVYVLINHESGDLTEEKFAYTRIKE